MLVTACRMCQRAGREKERERETERLRLREREWRQQVDDDEDVVRILDAGGCREHDRAPAGVEGDGNEDLVKGEETAYTHPIDCIYPI